MLSSLLLLLLGNLSIILAISCLVVGVRYKLFEFHGIFLKYDSSSRVGLGIEFARSAQIFE